MKVSFSDLFFITLVEQNKNTGCNDIEIFGTWSHDPLDISILLYRNLLLGRNINRNGSYVML